MYLVDTSLWIDFLRQEQNEKVTFLQLVLAQDLPFGITSQIYQEILQGAASKADFAKLESYFSTQKFYHPKDSLLSHKEAARLFVRCREKGIIIRSTIDCLIAQIAIENDLTLLHHDKDFDHMKTAIAAL